MGYKEVYESWLSDPYFDEQTKEELRSIADDDNEKTNGMRLIVPFAVYL